MTHRLRLLLALSALLAVPPRLAAAERRASSAPRPPAASSVWAHSATAFAVRPDGVFLTVAHLVPGCRRFALGDGTALDLVAADHGRDLAVLRAPGLATPAFVRFRREPPVELGEPVAVLAFPLHGGRLDTGLNLTADTVTALRGTSGHTARFQLDAAMQRGGSGAPVLDGAGLLVGVAVSGLTRKVEREAGGVPQLMNYAVRGEVAAAFLAEHGVAVEAEAPGPPLDLREVARRTRVAVRLLLCFR